MAELKSFRQSAFKDVHMMIQQYKLDFQSTTKSMMNLVSLLNPSTNSCHYLTIVLYSTPCLFISIHVCHFHSNPQTYSRPYLSHVLYSLSLSPFPPFIQSLVFQFKSELDISAAEEAEAEANDEDNDEDKGSERPTSSSHGCSRSIQDILETYPLPFVSTQQNQ